MELTLVLNEIVLKYLINKNKYIVTYIYYYDDSVNFYLDRAFNYIYSLYSIGVLQYSNVCGDNVENVCKKLNINGINVGKIIITDWIIDQNKKDLDTIKLIYGPIICTINASYHALVYLEIIVNNNITYAAIETTSCYPHKLQFYIGKTKEELSTIVKLRYQCNDYYISYKDGKKIMDIVYNISK